MTGLAVTAIVAVLAGCAGGTATNAAPATGGAGSVATPTPEIDAGALAGRIAFMRGDPSQEEAVTYTVAPDGSDEREVFPEGNSASPTWSPGGTEIHVFCCGDGMAAHFVDPDTGDLLRALPQPEPSLELFCGGSWSPGGDRISCEGFGVEDPTLNGVYTIRASDGGGLRRVTSSPGGFDAPGDFSPDGERLVFTRFVDDAPVGVFVIELDGSGLVQVSPPDLTLDDTGFAGSWSPDGSQILFVGRASEGAHKEIWIVGADGSSPHRFEMTPPCGGNFSDSSSAGCYSPEWSPDGSMIVFTRSSSDGSTENIYIVNADGTGLRQVTNGGSDDNPDWGAPTGEPSSDIIGFWHRAQTCGEMLAAFEAAGLADSHRGWMQGNFYGGEEGPVTGDPCAGAAGPLEHSHWFTAEGGFGSHDQNGEEVDGGDFVLVDEDTLSFPSHASEFGFGGEVLVGFAIGADGLATFTVEPPNECDAACEEAHAWALSAFSSGPWAMGDVP